MSSKWSLSLRFSHKNTVYSSSIPIHATFPAHFILDLMTRIIFSEDYRSQSSLCSLLHSSVTSPLLGTNILAPYSGTFSAHVPPSVCDSQKKGKHLTRGQEAAHYTPACIEFVPSTSAVHTHMWHKLRKMHTHYNLCRIGLYTITNDTYSLYLCVILWTCLKVFITSFRMRIL
jgi:hypothetical protein